ncbi:hypothetical protein D3C80_283440 [compost metagenome]
MEPKVPNFSTFEGDIFAWLEVLENEHSWLTNTGFNFLPEFNTYVNFDGKILGHNNPKAYHTRETLQKISDMIGAGTTGCWLFWWEEVRDEAHKFVRDTEEYAGSDLFGTVGYTMELFSRKMADNEEITLNAAITGK